MTNGDGTPLTAALSNPPPPDVSIRPVTPSGTSVSEVTSGDSTADRDFVIKSSDRRAASGFALGDAKQEIGVKYFGLTSGDYPGQQNEYNHNWIYKKMADRLVPGKIASSTNLIRAARVAEDAAASARFATAAAALQPPKAKASTLQNAWNVYTWLVLHPLSSNGMLQEISSSIATGNFAEAGKTYNLLLRSRRKLSDRPKRDHVVVEMLRPRGGECRKWHPGRGD